MSKKFLNLIYIFSSIIFFLPIIQSFYYPIELEVRESTLWLHIITIADGINIYDPLKVSYANQAHGPIDPIFKYLIYKLFPLLEPWQVSRLNNIFLYFSIFLVNFFVFKKSNNFTFIIFLSLLIYSFIFLLTKTFQGRADITAMLLLSVLCYLCSNKYIYKNNLNLLFVTFLVSIIIMTNWRFFPYCLAIGLFPKIFEKKIMNILNLKNIYFYLVFFILLLIPFIIILYIFFHLNLQKYYNYFVNFFYFENHFSTQHYIGGLKNIIRIEKIYFLLILQILVVFNILKNFKLIFFEKFIVITISLLVTLTCFVSYLYNYIGGGIYYFTPLVFFIWYLIMFFYKNHKFNFNFRYINFYLFLFVSVFVISVAIKNSLKSSIGIYKSYSNALNLHNYLTILYETNTNILSESLHFHKNKYSNEKIDIGDLISYRSSQVGGEYEKTYKSHLKDISNGKYEYIIHNFTGSKVIDNLITTGKYKVIKTFSGIYSNIGEVLILRKNILSK
jgi:hypothetical protein